MSVKYRVMFHRGESGRGGILDVMHGRSRMTMDHRVPTMPGQSTSGFHRSGKTLAGAEGGG